MLRPYSLPLVASLTLVVLLLVSCSDTADDSADTTLARTTTTTAAPPTTTTQPVLDAEAVARAATEGIEVTFTEEECSHSGPSVLPEGEYEIIFRGVDGRSPADFYVQSIDDGKTYQDIVELQGGVPGKYYGMPAFITYATTVGSDFDISTGDRRTTYAFEVGEYYVDAFKGSGAWLCGAFAVVAE